MSTDQDGVARPQNFSCDVGAYEHVWSTSELMTLLLAQLNGFGAPHGIVSTANAANVAIAYGQYGIACSALSNVSSNIQSLAMRGQFPPGPAAAIQQSAGAVRSSIGC